MSLNELKDAIVNFDEAAVQMIDTLGDGIDEILNAISDALAIVGEKYESHEYFLSISESQ